MNNDTKYILEIEDLYVTYETDDAKVYAINGISLRLEEGKTLGLVGETGAGKTTTALSVMRLLPPKIGKIEKGRIILDGHDLGALKEGDMRLLRGETVSMIFQDPMTSLNPVINVGEQIKETIRLHMSIKNNAELDRRVDEILQLVGISPKRKNEFPHQFSGGMKQRVVIAIALACEPKLILADEPTTALDVTIQAQVLQMMEELKQKLNTSMIMITHDLGIVAETCDDVAIMYAGEIIEYGSIEDIYESAIHHPYTIGLFDSIPDLTKKTERLNPIPGLMPDPTVQYSGCPFADRCPKRLDRCETEKPSVYCEGKHLLKCHLFDGILKKLGDDENGKTAD